MKNLTATICLSVALLFGTSGVSWSQNFPKGLSAYESGDYATAIREWTPLAEQGDADAQYDLGVVYNNGTGVLQDCVRAHMWFNIAASSGNKVASKIRDLIAKEMTPSQLEKSQGLARVMVKSNRI